MALVYVDDFVWSHFIKDDALGGVRV